MVRCKTAADAPHIVEAVYSLSLFCPLKRVRCCASNQAHNGAPVGPLTGTEDPPTWPHVSATQTRGSAAVSPNWARP